MAGGVAGGGADVATASGRGAVPAGGLARLIGRLARGHGSGVEATLRTGPGGQCRRRPTGTEIVRLDSGRAHPRAGTADLQFLGTPLAARSRAAAAGGTARRTSAATRGIE